MEGLGLGLGGLGADACQLSSRLMLLTHSLSAKPLQPFRNRCVSTVVSAMVEKRLLALLTLLVTSQLISQPLHPFRIILIARRQPQFSLRRSAPKHPAARRHLLILVVV